MHSAIFSYKYDRLEHIALTAGQKEEEGKKNGGICCRTGLSKSTAAWRSRILKGCGVSDGRSDCDFKGDIQLLCV